MGGFECSTHRTRSGRRLDMIAATAHDKYAVADYLRLHDVGGHTVRDGIRWHLIEPAPNTYDFSSLRPMLRAARETNTQVIWDLCHYGWPDDIDIFKPEFVRRFVRLTRAFVKVLADEADDVPFIAPVNEISFFAWASGEVGIFYPFGHKRGDELKTQLVRVAIESTEAIWAALPGARIVHTDPVINVIANPTHPRRRAGAERYRLAQYQALDMLAGKSRPELGGAEKYLDIIGVNYYSHNQWTFPDRTMIPRTHPLYRPFREILREVYERYRRPLFVAETGAESDERVDWFRYVCQEVRAAMRTGTPIEGVCLYPIVNHPGWDDDRHCYNGLWDYPDETGGREIYQPLADELRRQRLVIDEVWRANEAEPTTVG